MGNFKFGMLSEQRLSTVHPALREIARRALELSEIDFGVSCGWRSKADQEKAFKGGFSKVRFPNSAHNPSPACAIDIIPYPFVGWNDKRLVPQLVEISEAFFKASKELGVDIRWGGDFNRDGNKTTSDGWDKMHYELHPWRDWRDGKRK